MEAIGMSLVAFVAANILENVRRFVGVAPKGSKFSLAPPKRKNPRDNQSVEEDTSQKNEKLENIFQDPNLEAEDGKHD